MSDMFQEFKQFLLRGNVDFAAAVVTGGASGAVINSIGARRCAFSAQPQG